MFEYESTVLATKIIKDDALYLGIFDITSVVNSVNQWEKVWDKAKRDVGKESWQTLFYANDSWIDFAKKGEVLSWITLFHGVFKVELRLISEYSQLVFKANETKHFLGEGEFNRLYCPSGKITVASLGDLGTDLISPITEIDSGWYKMAFYCNDAQENDHYFLEDESEYPIDSDSDWIIYLQKET